MAKSALPVLLIFLLPAVAGLSFNVDLAALTNHSVKDLQYRDEVQTVQNVNASVTNVGSIGCTYRMKADYSYGNESFTRYSPPTALWQGGSDRLEVQFMPLNYSGEVDTNISLTYCGQTERIDSFTFNDTENTTSDTYLDSRTVEVSEDGASVELEEGEMLVPKEEPSYWKTSSAKVVNGTSTVEYDAPIFQEGEKITYSVLSSGTVIGETTVNLEPEPTFWEKLQDRKLEVFKALLGVSVLFNLVLVLKHVGVFERIRSLEYELPEFRNEN
jgi:hypothetical protein